MPHCERDKDATLWRCWGEDVWGVGMGRRSCDSGPISSHPLFHTSPVLGPDIKARSAMNRDGLSGWSCFACPRDLLLFVECICSAFVEWNQSVALQASSSLESTFEIGLKLRWRCHFCDRDMDGTIVKMKFGMKKIADLLDWANRGDTGESFRWLFTCPFFLVTRHQEWSNDQPITWHTNINRDFNRCGPWVERMRACLITLPSRTYWWEVVTVLSCSWAEEFCWLFLKQPSKNQLKAWKGRPDLESALTSVSEPFACPDVPPLHHASEVRMIC